MFSRILVVLLLTLFPHLGATQEVKEIRGVKYTEEVHPVQVPYDFGFFSTDIRPLTISTIVWKPVEKKFEKAPLIMISHGSQLGGTAFPASPIRFLNALNRGYVVAYTFRKGFNRQGTRASDASANKAEPVSCSDHAGWQRGISSASEDVTAALATLKKDPAIDSFKLILAGQSRGAYLSVFLGAKTPETNMVVNFVGGWYSEGCLDHFNLEAFKNYGELGKAPVLSFYGDRDNFYSVNHIRRNAELLEKIPGSELHILPGGDHFVIAKTDWWWPIFERKLDELEAGWKKQ